MPVSQLAQLAMQLGQFTVLAQELWTRTGWGYLAIMLTSVDNTIYKLHKVNTLISLHFDDNLILFAKVLLLTVVNKQQHSKLWQLDGKCSFVSSFKQTYKWMMSVCDDKGQQISNRGPILCRERLKKRNVEEEIQFSHVIFPWTLGNNNLMNYSSSSYNNKINNIYLFVLEWKLI